MNYCTIVPDIVRSFYMSTVETNKRLFIIIIIIKNLTATVQTKIYVKCLHNLHLVESKINTFIYKKLTHWKKMFSES